MALIACGCPSAVALIFARQASRGAGCQPAVFLAGWQPTPRHAPVWGWKMALSSGMVHFFGSSAEFVDKQSEPTSGAKVRFFRHAGQMNEALENAYAFLSPFICPAMPRKRTVTPLPTWITVSTKAPHFRRFTRLPKGCGPRRRDQRAGRVAWRQRRGKGRRHHTANRHDTNAVHANRSIRGAIPRRYMQHVAGHRERCPGYFATPRPGPSHRPARVPLVDHRLRYQVVRCRRQGNTRR